MLTSIVWLVLSLIYIPLSAPIWRCWTSHPLDRSHSMRMKFLHTKIATGTYRIYRHPWDQCPFELTGGLHSICNRSINHSVEAPNTAAGVFKLASPSLNTLGEQRELLVSVDRLHGAIWSSETNMHLLQRQVSSLPAELWSVWSKASRPEAFREGAICQTWAPQTALTTVETNQDQNRALVDDGSGKRRNMEAMLVIVQSHLEDNSYLLCSSHETFAFWVWWSLTWLFGTLIEVVLERTVATRPLSSESIWYEWQDIAPKRNFHNFVPGSLECRLLQRSDSSGHSLLAIHLVSVVRPWRSFVASWVSLWRHTLQ